MSRLVLTLVADGTSDACLMPIIEWTVLANFPDIEFESYFAHQLPPFVSGLLVRAQAALRLYPCDVIFVHRDAEGVSLATRTSEIEVALANILTRRVPVVPVRMSEAWLLSDEAAVRKAAGNPTGAQILELPRVSRLEQLADPKQILFTALKTASGHRGRKLRKFDLHRARNRVAELTADFSELRTLPAFSTFEDRVVATLRALI